MNPGMNIQATKTSTPPDTFAISCPIFLETHKIAPVVIVWQKHVPRNSHRLCWSSTHFPTDGLRVDLLGKTQLPNEDPSQAAALGRWLVDPTEAARWEQTQRWDVGPGDVWGLEVCIVFFFWGGGVC